MEKDEDDLEMEEGYEVMYGGPEDWEDFDVEPVYGPPSGWDDIVDADIYGGPEDWDQFDPIKIDDDPADDPDARDGEDADQDKNDN